MGTKVDTRTAKQRNQAARKEALREQLAAYGHHQKAVDLIDKITDVAGTLDPKNANMEALEVKRYEIALKGHMEFVKKYLPDQKSVEVSQDPESPVLTEDQIDARLARLIQAISDPKG